jgi:hypothetical protein
MVFIYALSLGHRYTTTSFPLEVMLQYYKLSPTKLAVSFAHHLVWTCMFCSLLYIFCETIARGHCEVVLIVGGEFTDLWLLTKLIQHFEILQRLRLIEVFDVQRLQMRYATSSIGWGCKFFLDFVMTLFQYLSWHILLLGLLTFWLQCRGPSVAATFVAVYALFGPTFPGTYNTKRCIYTLFYPVSTYCICGPSPCCEICLMNFSIIDLGFRATADRNGKLALVFSIPCLIPRCLWVLHWQRQWLLLTGVPLGHAGLVICIPHTCTIYWVLPASWR